MQVKAMLDILGVVLYRHIGFPIKSTVQLPED